MGINQRVSLRKFIDDVRRWVEEGRSDEWIASALGTSPSSVQSFRSRNAIYRRDAGSILHDPREYNAFEGVVESEGSGSPGVWFDPSVKDDPRWLERWSQSERVEVRLTPTRIVLVRRGGQQGGSQDGARAGARGVSSRMSRPARRSSIAPQTTS